MKKIAFIDNVHSVLKDQLAINGFLCVDFTLNSKEEVYDKIVDFEGIVIRSKFPLDRTFLLKAQNLEFIARSGAGMENIDIKYCNDNDIAVYNAPEGNRNAVGEHALGMLLSLFNNLYRGNLEIRNGIWNREENRGVELEGKIVAIIGFGHNGSEFAKKLIGFDVEVLAYDKYKEGFGNEFVREVQMEEIYERADVISFHIPQNDETMYLFNYTFIKKFKKSIYLINLSRGKIVETKALVDGLKSNKIKGACLDVLEFEKTSFENMFSDKENLPKSLDYLINSDKVLLSPHVGGWTKESYYKLSFILLNKILNHYSV